MLITGRIRPLDFGACGLELGGGIEIEIGGGTENAGGTEGAGGSAGPGGTEIGGTEAGGTDSGASSTPSAEANAAARSSGRGSGAFFGRIGLGGSEPPGVPCFRFKIRCSSAFETRGAKEITWPTASS
jgi:hypothetical protein